MVAIAVLVDAFDAYELKGNPAEEDDDCEFRRLAKSAILG